MKKKFTAMVAVLMVLLSFITMVPMHAEEARIEINCTTEVLDGERVKISVAQYGISETPIINIEGPAVYFDGVVYTTGIGEVIVTAKCGKYIDTETITVKSNYISLPTEMRDVFYINYFTTVLQNPDLPTGCEVTALTQTLNYYGYDADKTYMADNYLPKAGYGGNFWNTFIGNPKSSHGYGCYAPVIEKTANDYFAANGSRHTALNFSGTDIDNIYRIVNEGYPVVILASMNMVPIRYRVVWNDHNGYPVTWTGNEHCMTLLGYDKIEGTVLIADPLRGTVTYDMATFEKRYEECYKQAIVIKETPIK